MQQTMSARYRPWRPLNESVLRRGIDEAAKSCFIPQLSSNGLPFPSNTSPNRLPRCFRFEYQAGFADTGTIAT